MTILVVIPVEQRHKEYLLAKAPDTHFIYTTPNKATQEEIASANIIIGNVSPKVLKEAVNLQWLQLNTAGADLYTKEGILPEGTLLTNATGAYGLAISEHMLGTLLVLQKKLHIYQEHQKNHRWVDEGEITSIYGSTTLVVGMGDIGGEFAKRVKALGSYTIGIRRTKAAKPDYIDELYTMESLDEVLKRADIVALSLPQTPETCQLFNAERLSTMKKGAYLLNVGRGSAIDSMALCEALSSGHLAGAGLDVTDPEPLPSDHPLWDAKNILITPHISGQYHLQETFERIVRIAGENLERFLEDKPLKNEVDFKTGYRKVGEVK